MLLIHFCLEVFLYSLIITIYLKSEYFITNKQILNEVVNTKSKFKIKYKRFFIVFY